jgi:hypothetical protein
MSVMLFVLSAVFLRRSAAYLTARKAFLEPSVATRIFMISVLLGL